jgi:alpha 1,3-glucosidase
LCYVADTFLVAPIVDADQTEIVIAFPPGRWRPFERQEGGWLEGTVNVSLGPDGVPVFIREGKIAPIYDKIGSHAQSTMAGPLTLVIAPSAAGTAEGLLYLDDGTSYNYKTGEFLDIKFSFSSKVLTASKVRKESTIPVALEKAIVGTIVIFDGNSVKTYPGLTLDLTKEWTWSVPAA